MRVATGPATAGEPMNMEDRRMARATRGVIAVLDPLSPWSIVYFSYWRQRG